jgi:hypothetical protein
MHPAWPLLGGWILHSCEVIPTATDETTSFDVWWNIFQGMHAAVGYRTEMWIDDGVTSPFGLLMGLGAPVVSAWFSSIASNDLYGANDQTYFDNNRQITNRWAAPRRSPCAIMATTRQMKSARSGPPRA